MMRTLLFLAIASSLGCTWGTGGGNGSDGGSSNVQDTGVTFCAHPPASGPQNLCPGNMKCCVQGGSAVCVNDESQCVGGTFAGCSASGECSANQQCCAMNGGGPGPAWRLACGQCGPQNRVCNSNDQQGTNECSGTVCTSAPGCPVRIGGCMMTVPWCTP